MVFPDIHIIFITIYSTRRECFRGSGYRHRPLDAVGQIDDDYVVVIHVRGKGRRDGPVIFYFYVENKKTAMMNGVTTTTTTHQAIIICHHTKIQKLLKSSYRSNAQASIHRHSPSRRPRRPSSNFRRCVRDPPCPPRRTLDSAPRANTSR